MIVKKSDIETLSTDAIKELPIRTLYLYSTKIVQCKMAKSFNAKIAEQLGIPSNYIGMILSGEREGKRYRENIENMFRAAMLEYIDNAQ